MWFVLTLGTFSAVSGEHCVVLTVRPDLHVTYVAVHGPCPAGCSPSSRPTQLGITSSHGVHDGPEHRYCL